MGASTTPCQNQDKPPPNLVTGRTLHTVTEENKHTNSSDSDRAEAVNILMGGTVPPM